MKKLIILILGLILMHCLILISTARGELSPRDVMHFIKYFDRTNEQAYIENEYDCDGFARDLIKSLRGLGVNAHMVFVMEDDSILHAVVAVFFKTYKRVLLIEPQSDEEVSWKYDRNGNGKIDFFKEDDVFIVDYNKGRLCLGEKYSLRKGITLELLIKIIHYDLIKNGSDGLILLDLDYK